MKMAFKIHIILSLSKVETPFLYLWILFLLTLPTSSSVIRTMCSYLRDYFTPKPAILMHANFSRAHRLPFQVISWVSHSFPSLHLLFLLVPHREHSLPCRLAQLKWFGATNNELCLWRVGQRATNTFLPLNLVYLLYCYKAIMKMFYLYDLKWANQEENEITDLLLKPFFLKKSNQRFK